MEELEIRGLVRGWHQRARRETDFTSKFVFLWFCFNAWLAHESNEDTDREMIQWLTGAPATTSQLRAAFDLASRSDVFVGYLRALAALSPITSTGRRHREVRIDSLEDSAASRRRSTRFAATSSTAGSERRIPAIRNS